MGVFTGTLLGADGEREQVILLYPYSLDQTLLPTCSSSMALSSYWSDRDRAVICQSASSIQLTTLPHRTNFYQLPLTWWVGQEVALKATQVPKGWALLVVALGLVMSLHALLSFSVPNCFIY